MPSDAEVLIFVELFAKELREKMDVLADQGIKLEIGQERLMAKQLVDALIEFKYNLSIAVEKREIKPHQKGGLILWEEKKEQLVSDLAKKLDAIFSPIGGVRPGVSSVFFSGTALQKSIPKLGVNLGSTIPGFIFNKVEHILQLTRGVFPRQHSCR